MYRTAQQRAWDNYSILEYAKKESREEERLKAIAKEREIAKTLKVKGIDLKIIADATGISIDEIIAL